MSAVSFESLLNKQTPKISLFSIIIVVSGPILKHQQYCSQSLYSPWCHTLQNKYSMILSKGGGGGGGGMVDLLP